MVSFLSFFSAFKLGFTSKVNLWKDNNKALSAD